MDDPFNQDDRTGPAPIENTIMGLSKLLAPRVTLLDTPLVMRSYKNEITFEAPYFEGKRVRFLSKFRQALRTKDNFCFLIIANSFKVTFTSHALVGWWNKGVLTLFDPNGDFYTPDPDSVYNGDGYFIAPQREGLRNPLYNTLIQYFGNLGKIRVYTADTIPCPRGETRTCIYRALMYVVATSKTSDPVKVVQYTSKLVKTKFKKLKEMAKISSLYLVIGDDEINNLFMTNLNNTIDPRYLSLRQPLPPQPPHTQPPQSPPPQHPGKRRKEAS